MTDVEMFQARFAGLTEMAKLQAKVAALTDLVEFLIDTVDEKLFAEPSMELTGALMTIFTPVEAKAS